MIRRKCEKIRVKDHGFFCAIIFNKNQILRLKIILIKQSRIEKFAQAYLHSLTHLMYNSELHGIIRTIYNIADRGFWYTA